jgi:hypothetical protein
MPLVTGGVLEEWGAPKAALVNVQRQIREFHARSIDEQYAVDIAFRTWHNFRDPEEPYGVTPGPVGRSQRRFIVWHSVPKGLETPQDVRAWLVEALLETERLVREYLPRRSKAYPAEQLADEVAALREHLAKLGLMRSARQMKRRAGARTCARRLAPLEVHGGRRPTVVKDQFRCRTDLYEVLEVDRNPVPRLAEERVPSCRLLGTDGRQADVSSVIDNSDALVNRSPKRSGLIGQQPASGPRQDRRLNIRAARSEADCPPLQIKP